MNMRNIIQVGVGSMGQCWAMHLAASKQWRTAALVDVDEKALHATADKYHIPRELCFTDLKRALKNVEADALLDVTPQQYRKRVCRTAFDAGLHVLSEKPLADTLRNAMDIVAAAKKAKRTYMVAQNYRYQSIIQTARDYIKAGKLGEIGYAGVNFHKGPHFGGFREEMAYPLILDMSIHHFDLIRCLLGNDVKTVTAASLSAPWNWNKGDATVMAQLQLDKGVPVNYFASWNSTGWETTWNADWRIEGSKGALLIEQDKLYVSNKESSRKSIRLKRLPAEHQAYLLRAFDGYLKRGEEPETSGRRNLNSLATTHAVVQAAKTKKTLKVAALL
jgi:predicted dehydrogenase